MTMQEVIENECAKCDLVLPKEEIINAYNKALRLEKENTALKQDWEIMKNTITDYNDFCDKYMRLEKELKSEKEYSATLRKEIDEYTNSHTLCAKYKELQKACDETQEQLTKAKELIRDVLTNGNYNLNWKVKAEQFLKECE